MTETALALTVTDRANLRWMVNANRAGVGLFGRTVRRNGALADMTPLVDAGLCTLAAPGPRRGYWITPAGRAAIAEEGT